MECAVSIEKDTIAVLSNSKPMPLRLSITKPYCQLFETTTDQSRDYVEEVVSWFGGYPSNFDVFSKNLMHCTAVRRKQYGFEK